MHLRVHEYVTNCRSNKFTVWIVVRKENYNIHATWFFCSFQELNENGECTVRFVAYTASKEDGFDVVETNRRPCSESSSGNVFQPLKK